MAASTSPVSDRSSAIRIYRRSRRTLFLFAGASLALHAVVLAVLPRFNVEEDVAVPAVLDVVLVEAVFAPDVPPAAAPREREPAPAMSSPVPKARVEPRPAPKRPPRATKSEREARASARNEERSLPVPQPAPGATPPHMQEEAARDTGERAPAPRPQVTPQGAEIKPPPVAEVTPPAFNASYLRNPAPRYPLLARRNGEQGTVTLRVLVARDGTPVRVTVEQTSGSPRLDGAALETVRTWRFVPARNGKEAIEAWVLVPIVFRLEGAS